MSTGYIFSCYKHNQIDNKIDETFFDKTHGNFCRPAFRKLSIDFRIILAKLLDLFRKLWETSFFFDDIREELFSTDFRVISTSFREMLAKYWSEHISNGLSTGLACTAPRIASPWSLHTLLAISCCVKVWAW